MKEKHCKQCGKRIKGARRKFCNPYCQGRYKYLREKKDGTIQDRYNRKVDYLNSITPDKLISKIMYGRGVYPKKRKSNVINISKNKFISLFMIDKLHTGQYSCGDYLITFGIKGRTGSQRVKDCLDRDGRRVIYYKKRRELYQKRKEKGICVKCGIRDVSDSKFIICDFCRAKNKQNKLRRDKNG